MQLFLHSSSFHVAYFIFVKKVCLQSWNQFWQVLLCPGFAQIWVYQTLKFRLSKQSLDIQAIKITENLSFVAFQFGIRCTVKTLSKNKITVMDSWSKITEAIRYLSTNELSRQENVLRSHIEEMGPKVVGKKTYSLDTLIRAYSYFSTSRSLYQKLRRDYKQPSVTTLTNLTSKVNNTSD